ncbi:hypothetical protein ACTXT7_009561 [Hymenolepis weldensis]
MDPYKLPCNHSLCLTPCIALNDRATVVACPICQISCSFNDLIPDKNLRERANAYITRQSLHIQSPYYSPQGYGLNDNGSSYEREGIPTREFYQQSQGLSGIPEPTNLLPLSEPQKCQLCNLMVFGLYYVPALQASICAACREERFNRLVDVHIDKIREIKERRESLVRLEEYLRSRPSSRLASTIEDELDTAIHSLFKTFKEYRLKAEKELQDHNASIDKWLREMHTNMSKIEPEVKGIPDLVKELEKSGVS